MNECLCNKIVECCLGAILFHGLTSLFLSIIQYEGPKAARLDLAACGSSSDICTSTNAEAYLGYPYTVQVGHRSEMTMLIGFTGFT